MDKLDLLLTKVKREKANAAQGGIDGAYINQFLKDAGSFVTEQKTTLDSADWAKSTDAAANKARGEALFDLTSRADMISKYLEANKGAIQKASYNDLKNALRQYTQSFASVRGISEGNKNFYSQFATQQDYDNYVAEEAEKAKTAEEKRKVLEQIDKTRQDYANWKTQADIVEGSDIYIGGNPLQHERVSTIVQEGGLLRPLYEQVGEKDIYEWNLEKITSTAKKDPQYKEYVKKASDVEGIIKNSEFKDVIEPEELELLKYFIAKDRENGTKLQDDYIYYMEEIWAQRAGAKEAEWYKDKPFLAALYGVKSGWDQIGSNLSNLGNMFSMDPDKGYAPQTQSQVASGLIRENLDGFGKFIFDVGSATTNMVPSILLSTAVGILNPAAGAATGGALRGAGAAGSAYSEKVQAGWSQSEASSYAAMVGASEMALESVLGAGASAAGKGVRGLLSKVGQTGLKKIDDILAKAAKNAAGKIGAEMLSEGFEEGVQSILEPYFAHVASGEEFTVDMEEALYSALLGAVTGGLFGGVRVAVDTVTENKLTKNEKKVLQAEVDARIKEQQEQQGRELTGKEKSDIEKKVEAQLRKGQISTDRIEAALGGEGYAKYQTAYDREQAALKELEGLYEGEALKQQQQQLRDNSVLQGLREELSRSVSDSVKNDRFLHESYLDKGRRSEAFTADVSKYKGKAAQIVQKAIDSGVLNNTSRSHELVDLIAKIGADKDIDFDFVNNEKLRESGFAIAGATINGYVTDSGITMNVDSAKALNSVVGHEITHVLEGSEMYSQLAQIAKEYAEAKGEYKDRYKELVDLYQKAEGYKGTEGLEKIKAELVADLIGDYLFTDEAFVKRLLENRNLFQKSWDEIKYLCKLATAGTVEAEKLTKMERTFEKVFQSETKNPTREGEVKYDLSDAKIPTKEELSKKDPIKVVDISTPQTKGTFAERREQILESASDIISKPYLNKDTGAMIFLTEKSYTHAFSNSGDIQLNATEHLPELIENAVLTHAEKPTHGSEYANGIYTFFAAAKADRIRPVKLKVKEYSYKGQDLPKNIKAYFDGLPEGYAASYDTVVLEVEEIEKSPSGSAKDMNQNDPFLSPDELLTIKVADLLELVKGNSEKYIPKFSQSDPNVRYSMSDKTKIEKADGWQIKGVDVLLQQEADKNGLVWENGVPFRKDLLELARKRQSGEFQIAPPVPESAKTETAKSQAAANIAPPTPAEDTGWKAQKQEQLRKKLKNDEKQYRGMQKMLSEEITALQAQLDQVKDKNSQKAAEIRKQIKEREESQKRWKALHEETSQKTKEEILRLEAEVGSTEAQKKSVAPPTPAEQEVEDIVKEADGDEDEVESRLQQKKKNLEWQLLEQKKLRDEYQKTKEEKIAAVRKKLEELPNKDTKEARKLKNRILRMEREKANELVEYDDKIRKTQNRITVTEERIAEDHTYQNRLENAYKRIEQIREMEENEATEQYNRERDALLEEVENRSQWISKKATSVKREMLNWEKDKSKASPLLRELLASDHDWRELETALADVAEYPTKPYKTTTDAEDTVRAILSEAYADAYDKNMGKIERLDADFEKQIKKINAEAAERKKKSTIAHKRKESNTKYLLEVAKIVGDTSTWKDKKRGISYKTNTLRRNLEDIVKDAEGKPDLEKAHRIYDYLQGTYNSNEAQLKRELNELFDKYRSMKITKEENVYIQMLGEATQGSGDGVKTNATIQQAEEYYDANKDKIDDAKCRKIIEMAREDYDKAFERVNAVLREHGMEELKYVQGYFPHLEEAPQKWWKKGLNFQPIKPQTELEKSRAAKANASKTSVAGRTGIFKPNKKSQSYAKERKGPKTDFNFLKGYEAYMTGALDWIYHIPDIQRRRAMENYIRITHAENDLALTKKIKDIQKSDVYNADEEQVALEEVFKTMETPLSNFVTDLMIGTNALAGKKTSGDRSVEEFLSPETANTLKNLSGRVSANMVAGSISSALTNFIPITQSWGQVSPLYSLKAAKQMILGSAGGVKSGRIKDGIVEASTFLTNRLRNPDKLYKQFWDKVSTGAGALMETFDNVTSQIVWRSKFLQNLDEGMSEADAIKNADEFAEGLMAGRSRGNMPTLFESKNAIAKMATAFQLEVNNQYGYMFKDMPKAAKEKGLLRIAKGYMAMFAGAYVYNALYSMLTGRDSAFDPIGIIEEAIKGFQDDEEDVWADVWGVTQNVLQELPFVGGLLGGGRVPMSSALPYEGNLEAMFEGFADMSEGDWSDLTNEWLNPVYYLLAPMGGGQLKKSIGGALMYWNDKEIKGSYTDSGNLRFPVGEDLLSFLQAITMGQWSSGNARDYFEGGHKPLTEKQQEEFAESGMTIQEYWDYRDALGKLNKQAEKLDYINGMDVDEDTKYVLKWYLFDADKAAEEDPERFEWLENEIGYVEYRELDKDAQEKWSWAYNNQEEYEYMKKNGIRLEDVDVFTVTMTDFNSQKSAVAASLGGAAKYKEYMDEIGDVKGDKNANGDTISGSVKKNVWAYIDELDLEDGQKYILFKLKYPKDTEYDHKIVGYLRGRKDLTAQKRVDIYNELGIEP